MMLLKSEFEIGALAVRLHTAMPPTAVRGLVSSGVIKWISVQIDDKMVDS
jgi:hypothetical protein